LEIKRLKQFGLHVLQEKATLFSKALYQLKLHLSKRPESDSQPWDTKFEIGVADLIDAVGSEYTSEKKFQQELSSHLKIPLGVLVESSLKIGAHGSVEADLGHKYGDLVTLILETKLGSGSGGGDAATQLLGYYLHSLTEHMEEFWKSTHRPTILIAAVKNCWTVYGAVFLQDTVCFEELGHLALNDLETACFQFWGIKQCLHQIEKSVVPYNEPFFPWIRSITINGVETNLVEFKPKRLYWKKTLFSIDLPKQQAVVKFTKHYSIAAHSSAGEFAPTLIGHQQVSLFQLFL